jgi:hypothetical protein
MDTRENASLDFTAQERQAINFLAAGKMDTKGNKWTIEDFCEQVIKVHPATFYRWQSRIEFRQAVLEETMGRVTQFVPDMVKAQVHKAIKKQDTPAFMAVMRQAGIIKSDKQEIKAEVDGNMTFNLVNYADHNNSV